MRKYYGLLILAVILLIVSCKKDAPSPTPSGIGTTSTDTLTQNVYTIDTLGVVAPPGIILSSPFDVSIHPWILQTGLLLIMDQNGKVLKKQTTPGEAFDFRRWIINGKTRYTYFVNNPNTYRSLGFFTFAGYYVIADSNLNTLQKIEPAGYGQDIFHPGQELDPHEFVLISDSDYITLSYVSEYVNNIPQDLHPAPNQPVVAPIIEEVRNGALVWHWDGSQDTSFYRNSVVGNNFSADTIAQDYMHMNSIIIDSTDNNLICSMRNQNQVIKINTQTGNVMWRLGGKNSDFPLSPDQVFLFQHHATLTDNGKTLMLFDDGDPTARPYSRVVEFQLNQTNKTVTGFKYFTIPEPLSTIMGSVQKIGDDYFIGGGSGNYILEVNANTGQKVIEFKGTLSTYRAYKY